MRDAVEKASYCLWKIHLLYLFKMKYRPGLLVGAIVKLIMKTAKEIEEHTTLSLSR